MSPQAQRIAIALAAGFYLINPVEEDGLTAFSLREPIASTTYPWHKTEAEAWKDAPDYLNDLNAMHEAEEALLRGRDHTFIGTWESHVRVITQRDAKDGTGLYERIIRATAAQRAEAFLRTIGKWI